MMSSPSTASTVHWPVGASAQLRFVEDSLLDYF